MTPVAALEAGRPVEGVFAVRAKERRLSRRGEPYLALTLADPTGAVRAVVFDEPDYFAGLFAPGDRVRVTGDVVTRGGRPVVRVRHLRPEPGAAPPEDLLPRSHRDPDELWGFVLHLADEVGDPGMRAVLGELTGDAALAAAWRTVPCTRTGHHAYLGGLVEHTVGVAALCQALCTWHPRLDADLLVTAALAHDVGHTRAWRLGATIEPTEEGRLLGHLALGLDIVGAACGRAGLPAERRLALLHAVAWHHGPPAGQPAGGASAEALALWRANALEAGVKARLEGHGGLIDE